MEKRRGRMRRRIRRGRKRRRRKEEMINVGKVLGNWNPLHFR